MPATRTPSTAREREDMMQSPSVVVTLGSASFTSTDHGDGQVTWVIGSRPPSGVTVHWKRTLTSKELNTNDHTKKTPMRRTALPMVLLNRRSEGANRRRGTKGFCCNAIWQRRL